MGYELFDSKAVKIGDPSITITGGRLSLNADAGDILHRTGASFLHVLWDAEAYIVALRPVKKPDDKSYKITFAKGKRGASFSAQSFLNYIKWTGTEPKVVPIRWNEKEHLLEAALPKEFIGSAPPLRRAGKS